ncbi:MAG: amidohydrolase family protein [Bacteroidota bacterium]
MPSSYLIQNGKIYDGLGGEGYSGSVWILDGKIEKINPSPDEYPSDVQVIDATGLWVMPGFIDIHTHYDAEVEIAPELSESVRHGVTTIVMGSCGLSMVMGDPDELCDMFTRVEGLPSDYIKSVIRRAKNWNSPQSYLEHLESLPLGPNVAMFLGHSTIRAFTMGLGKSLSTGNVPTKEELDQMNQILKEALDCGYLGLSINLLEFDKMDGQEYRSRPTPSVFANWKEYRYLFKTLRKRKRILQTVPNIANPLTLFSFMWESKGIFQNGLKTSMLALADSKVFRGIHRILGLGSRMVNSLLNGAVKFQAVPVPFQIVTPGFDSPIFEEFETGTAYLHLEEVVERRDLLKTPAYRKKFLKQWNNRFKPRAFHRNLGEMTILSSPDKAQEGKSFADLAKEVGKDEIEYFLDLIQHFGSDLKWIAVAANDREDELNWIVQHPDVHVGFSDAGAHLKNISIYNFGPALLKLVHDRQQNGQKTMSIGKAVQKITQELADWYLLPNVGSIEEGKQADITLIDPNRLTDEIYQLKEAPMPGLPEYLRIVRRNDATVPYVFINGELAWEKGKPYPTLGKRKMGRVLRVEQN